MQRRRRRRVARYGVRIGHQHSAFGLGAPAALRSARMRPREGPMELKSVQAVVTGGASGLGRATGERIGKGGGGAGVPRLATPPGAPASRGAGVSKARGAEAPFTPADVTSAADVERALGEARQQLGGVNVLVNCAGIGTAAKTVSKGNPARLEDFPRGITA